jgi:lipopolysaccharide/colanic/teichoic acid biosynthesis glycosyltransferase
MQAGQLSLTKKDFQFLHSLKRGLFLTGGLLVLLSLSSVVAWSGCGFMRQTKSWPLLILCALAYLVTIVVLRQFQRLPRTRIVGLVLLSVSLAFVIVVVIIALGRFYYSRSFLLTSYGVTLAFLLLAFEFRAKSQTLRLAVVPGGMAKDLLNLRGVDWVFLQNPELPRRVDGLVVDWHEKLSGEWVRLLSNCSLRRLPVYHAAVVFEAATGKVSLAHLSAGLMDEFFLSPLYAAFKRFTDVTVVLVSAPLVLPLAMLLALAIRFDSSGPALFWQERVGQGGRSFRMVKFRSMRLDSEGDSACFAECGDRRITSFGRFIRTSRLDELPQFWNVLKGEMSLIGPRPEQVPFARRFENEIAFYGYRHLVKPGITGWAQVNRGYTAGTAETRDKLELDLYYIKYFSLWLDALVLFKTVRTILTGEGAR